MKTLSKKEDDHYDDASSPSLQAMLLAAGQAWPAVLMAATELNLFDIIAKGSPNYGGAFVSPSEIASQLPTHNADAPNRLDRMLRLLVSYSVLTCSTRTNGDGSFERLYGLSPSGEYFVSNDGGPSWPPLFNKSTYHPYMAEVLLKFKEAILDDGHNLFKKVFGQSMYEYVEKDPKLKSMFHRLMADFSALHMKKILETYKGFEGLSTLVDVGGGIGQSLKMILSKYPSIKGINFDLPLIIEDAPPFPGLQHVGGDMFKSVPEGDAIMIKSTTHNWPDEKCLQIFKNCHQALKKGGKVIVIDLIMPEEPEITTAAKYLSIFDNVMLCQLGEGKERSEKEFENLCRSSGFSGFHLACRALSVFGVMEFYK